MDLPCTGSSSMFCFVYGVKARIREIYQIEHQLEIILGGLVSIHGTMHLSRRSSLHTHNTWLYVSWFVGSYSLQ